MTKNYILIIWGSAKKYTNDIEKKINKRFQIYKSFNLGWSQDLFNNNLARFYYQNRINAKLKEVECSKSNFLVYVIHDNNPKFKTITLRSIKTLVNINIFNLKQELRNLTGGGHKIHASNNDEEFKKDYHLLGLQNLKDKKTYLHQNINGAVSWRSLEEALSFLNNHMHYVILRNYEHLNNIGNEDIDILVYNKEKASLLLNAKKISRFKFKSNYSINICNKIFRIDIRDVDDKYYCKDWCCNVLSTRIKYGKYFVPDKLNYDHLLTYHVYIHKYSIPEKYIKLFRNNNNKWLDLKDFMKLNNYNFVEPIDLSVAFNINSEVKKVTLKRKTYNLIRTVKNIFNNLLPHNFIVFIKKINAKIFT